MDPFMVRQFKQRRPRPITHFRGVQVCANLNQQGDRPLGTEWVWDSNRARPQLQWTRVALRSSNAN